MKLNKKGFMLAEVVVVSVVIATALVTLFTALNRLISAFETRNRYYDIDAAYLAVEINNILVEKNLINDILTNGNDGQLIELLSQDDYMNYFEDNGILNLYLNQTDNYIIPYVYNILNENNEVGLNNLIKSYTKQTFTEYINYLKGNIDFSDGSYIIIIELVNKEDENDCRYYALKVR